MANASISRFFVGSVHPLFFHALNVAFHLLNTILVFQILKQLIAKGCETKNTSKIIIISFFGALIFAIHPVQVEPVAWATGFKDISYTFFSLLAIRTFFLPRAHLASAQDAPDKRINRVKCGSATVFFLFALLCKPTAVILPLAILIILWGIFQNGPNRNETITIAIWFIFSAILGLFTISTQPSESYLSIFNRFIVFCDTITFYLYKFFLPFSPSLDYGRSIEYIIQGKWHLIPVLFIVILVVSLSFLKNRRIWLTVLGLFILGMAPVSGLLPFNHQKISTLADCYLYFSIFGMSVAVSFFIYRFYHSKILYAILGFIIIILVPVSTFYTYQWQNTKTLMAFTLKQNPKSLIAHNNIGVVCMKKENLSEAIAHFQKVLNIDSNNKLALYNMALAYALKNDKQAALLQQKKLLEMESPYGDKLIRVLPVINRALKNDGSTTQGQLPNLKNEFNVK